MTALHSPERFAHFLDLLTATAENDPRVIGLAGMGSTAEQSRADEWSDHDFALVTIAGHEDDFRHDLSWLPAASSIALSVVEHHGGVKVIYDDGHVLEFGIASPDSLATWNGNAVRIFYDAGGVSDAVARMIALPLPGGEPHDLTEVGLICTQLLIGVGRARRGEVLSAGQSVRFEAVTHLLTALALRVPSDLSLQDSLDPRRRFELLHPELARRIGLALERDVESAARELLAITEDVLSAGWHDFPHRGVAAVRRRLGWT